MEKASTYSKWIVIAILFTVHSTLFIDHAVAQIGTWRAYMSYYEPQQIQNSGEKLFVLASSALYSYNLNDHSITTYDKVRQLNDCNISHIAWNPQVNRLIIVYENCNIDLLDLNDNVVNISAFYTKTMTQDKTVNCITIYNQYAYLGTGFGVVKVDMQRAEISESYILDEDVRAIGFDDGQVYIRNKSWKFFVGDLSQNLIDPHNWSETAVPKSSIYTPDTSDWDNNIDLVRTLQPGGPKYNNFGFTKLIGNKLYTANNSGSLIQPGTVQVLNIDDDEWTFPQDDIKGNFPGTESSSWEFVNTYAIDVDPFDSNHFFAAGRTGLYEYYGDSLQHYYNKDNSILQTATSSNRYVIVSGMSYDEEGNLWMLQSQMSENSILEITKDGEWVKHPQSLLMDNGISLANLKSMYFDSRGLMWFVNSHWEKPSIYCYDTQKDEIVSSIIRLVNQDGISAREMYNPKCVAEDLEHNIWIGTNAGLYMIEASDVGGPLDHANQIKVPRNDGTNYADYLLANVDITSIAIDGGNRKWIGTSSGVFLISADNMTQIANYTTTNSALLSDKVQSITINNETGEVFIGTENGLCSYMSDATTASIEMVKDDVYAYPNPVVSGYDGLITIVGLSLDADVKILSTSGQLIAQGRSNGGTFTWNGRDRQGRRVASGVYMVACATSDGKKGTVCKIAVIR